MSKIGSHNYEAYFIDYHEGNLSSGQMKEVEEFVLLHPELQEEFEFLGDAKLEVPNLSLDKDWLNTLKKEELGLASNDDRLIALMEGQLNDEESNSLLSEIENDSTLQSEWQLFQATKVQHSAEDYQNKELLKAGLHAALPLFMEEKLDAWDQTLSLKPDEALAFGSTAQLKQGVKVVAFRKYFFQYASIAAAILFVWMLWPTNDPIGRRNQFAEGSGVELRSVSNEPSFGSEEPAEFIHTLEQDSQASNEVFFAQEEENGNDEKKERKLAPSKLNSRNYELIAMEPMKQDLAMPGNADEVAVDEFENIAAIDPTMRTMHGGEKVLTLGEFARQRLSKTLLDKEDPEEGLIYALLDRTAEKITENTETDVDFDGRKAEKGEKGRFKLSIGKLEIRR